MGKLTKPCGVPLTRNRYDEPDPDGPLCSYHRKPTKVKCRWHWLMSQPIEEQVKDAQRRRKAQHDLGFREVPRVKPENWPEGERWCAGCQSFVPLFYARGSRCQSCASEAGHASHVKRTYDLDPAEYERLLAWQGGVCFICGQRPRVRRLAVDHDHVTGQVRGLLCSNDEWGCNRTLARLLNNLEVARRALEYVEINPLERMRAGEAPRLAPAPKTMAEVFAPTTAPPVPLDDWRPFD